MNLTVIKSIWYDLALDEHDACVAIAGEFKRCGDTSDIGRKLISYVDDTEGNPLLLLREIADHYSI